MKALLATLPSNGSSQGIDITTSNGANFLSDVDPHGTPGNTAAAAYTTGRAELIDPRRQLVGHPLAKARFRRRPHATAVNVRVGLRETGVPTPPSPGVLVGYVAHVIHCGTETGGTYHGAVGATEATGGDIVPLGMIEVIVKKIA